MSKARPKRETVAHLTYFVVQAYKAVKGSKGKISADEPISARDHDHAMRMFERFKQTRAGVVAFPAIHLDICWVELPVRSEALWRVPAASTTSLKRCSSASSTSSAASSSESFDMRLAYIQKERYGIFRYS